MGYYAVNTKKVGQFAAIPGRHELGDVFEAQDVESGTHEILHRLDVVVGGFFNVFDGLRIGLAELLHALAQRGSRGW